MKPFWPSRTYAQNSGVSNMYYESFDVYDSFDRAGLSLNAQAIYQRALHIGFSRRSLGFISFTDMSSITKHSQRAKFVRELVDSGFMKENANGFQIVNFERVVPKSGPAQQHQKTSEQSSQPRRDLDVTSTWTRRDLDVTASMPSQNLRQNKAKRVPKRREEKGSEASPSLNKTISSPPLAVGGSAGASPDAGAGVGNLSAYPEPSNSPKPPQRAETTHSPVNASPAPEKPKAPSEPQKLASVSQVSPRVAFPPAPVFAATTPAPAAEVSAPKLSLAERLGYDPLERFRAEGERRNAEQRARQEARDAEAERARIALREERMAKAKLAQEQAAAWARENGEAV